VGRRSRQRARGGREPAPDVAAGLRAGNPAGAPPAAPSTVYTDAEGNQLELRGSLTAKARADYGRTLSGGLHQEDSWQRATELLFERLAVSWTISGLRIDHQKELLGRYRMAGADERRFIRDSLRSHVRQNFPELQAP
jgi:hypothetical protein